MTTTLRSYYKAPAWINSRPTDTDDLFAQPPVASSEQCDPFDGLSEADLLNIEQDRRAAIIAHPYYGLHNASDLL